MNVSDILKLDCIKINSNAKSKNDLINEMLKLANNSGQIENYKKAQEEIFKREKVMSTGIGKGIALPHAKTNAVKSIVGALSILPSPLEFDSLDGKPVNIVFLLLGKENSVSMHLKILSKISRLLNNENIKKQLLNSKDISTIKMIIEKFEIEY